MPVGAGAPSGPSARPVSSGFGNPAEDATVRRIDLNEALIRHADATFVMRAAGDAHAMAGAGIGPGDYLLVDRALVAASGHIVVAAVDGELMVRRLLINAGDRRLQACDPAVADIVASEDLVVEVWGVVTHVIKPLLV